MNRCMLSVVVGFIGVIFFIGNINFSEAGGRTRKWAADAASAGGQKQTPPKASQDQKKQTTSTSQEPSVSMIDPPLNFHTPGTELMLAGSDFNNVEEVFYNKVVMPSCRIVHDGMIDQCIIPSGATIPESSDNNKLITFKVKAPPPPSSTGGVKPPPPAVEVKAFPLTPAQEKQISKKSLEAIFIEEIKKHPGLQAFFQNETQKPFQYALKALQEKRHVEKFPQTHP